MSERATASCAHLACLLLPDDSATSKLPVLGRQRAWKERGSAKYRSGESLSECQFLLKYQINIATDVPTFAEMLNNPMFNFRKFITADLKSLLTKSVR
jgi:hypothetical protein